MSLDILREEFFKVSGSMTTELELLQEAGSPAAISQHNSRLDDLIIKLVSIRDIIIFDYSEHFKIQSPIALENIAEYFMEDLGKYGVEYADVVRELIYVSFLIAPVET